MFILKSARKFLSGKVQAGILIFYVKFSRNWKIRQKTVSIKEGSVLVLPPTYLHALSCS